jgi:hypothetical protein
LQGKGKTSKACFLRAKTCQYKNFVFFIGSFANKNKVFITKQGVLVQIFYFDRLVERL